MADYEIHSGDNVIFVEEERKPISHYISENTMLEQLAEECCELAQVCLKMVRKRKGENPTPLSEEEIAKNLNEEMGDVWLCFQELMFDYGTFSPESIDSVVVLKKERWLDRLEEAENSGDIKCE